jgi:hypothetical protein
MASSSVRASAQQARPLPFTVNKIVDDAVREVRKHRKACDEQNNTVVAGAKDKLRQELERLTKDGKLDDAIATRALIQSLETTVLDRAKAPMPLIQDAPPPMEQWVIGRWTGTNVPHVFRFTDGGAFEGVGKSPEAKTWRGAWKGVRSGFIDVDVEHGGRWEIRRCGPHAMAVVVYGAENKQSGDGIVLFRELDPVVGQWKWFNGDLHELWDDGQIKDQPGASWKVVDPTARKYTFSWKEGSVVDTLVLSPDGLSLKGTNNQGGQVSAERGK